MTSLDLPERQKRRLERRPLWQEDWNLDSGADKPNLITRKSPSSKSASLRRLSPVLARVGQEGETGENGAAECADRCTTL